MNIFLSFSGEGREEFAMKFLDFFNRHGLQCWYDQHELYLGDILSETIIKSGLDKSEYAILIINATFLSRSWPRTEATILHERATMNESVVLFPLLWDITKEEILNSDIPFIIQHKYQFINKETPLEVISYQIMNRIFHDIVKTSFNSYTLEDIRNHAKSLLLSRGIDVFNCLNMLSQVSPFDYEIQATILLIIIKLLNIKKFAKTVDTFSHTIYSEKKVNFDVCKILESILIINYFSSIT